MPPSGSLSSSSLNRKDDTSNDNGHDLTDRFNSVDLDPEAKDLDAVMEFLATRLNLHQWNEDGIRDLASKFVQINMVQAPPGAPPVSEETSAESDASIAKENKPSGAPPPNGNKPSEASSPQDVTSSQNFWQLQYQGVNGGSIGTGKTSPRENPKHDDSCRDRKLRTPTQNASEKSEVHDVPPRRLQSTFTGFSRRDGFQPLRSPEEEFRTPQESPESDKQEQTHDSPNMSPECQDIPKSQPPQDETISPIQDSILSPASSTDIPFSSQTPGAETVQSPMPTPMVLPTPTPTVGADESPEGIPPCYKKSLPETPDCPVPASQQTPSDVSFDFQVGASTSLGAKASAKRMARMRNRQRGSRNPTRINVAIHVGGSTPAGGDTPADSYQNAEQPPAPSEPQPSPIFSPMAYETFVSPPPHQPTFPPPADPVAAGGFSIGSAGAKAAASPSNRARARTKVSSPNNRSRTRRAGGKKTPSHLSGSQQASFSTQNQPFTGIASNLFSSVAPNPFDEQKNAIRQQVEAIKEKARVCFASGDYRSSVRHYTMAFQAIAQDNLGPACDGRNDLLALLHSNRGAGFMMLGAYKATVTDCGKGLQLVTDAVPFGQDVPSDSGPVLKCKLAARLGRALLKSGNLDDADTAFQLGIDTASSLLAKFQLTPKSVGDMNAIKHDGAVAKTEVHRCREIIEQLRSMGMENSESPLRWTRRTNIEALSQVNLALAQASGCVELHEMKVGILAALKRWRDLAGHCERLAADAVKYDGIFPDDLEQSNPYPGVSRSVALTSDFFEGDQTSMRKLMSKTAVVDAVVRLPARILPFYMRSLRLEERYPVGKAAVDAIERLVQPSSKLIFSWVRTEKSKLDQTEDLKNQGDQHFLNGDYPTALECYATCMLVDDDTDESRYSSEKPNAGGKLHAVLHCNRAACYIQLEKFQDALNECSAALRIHSHYMKAILRRARCHHRLHRFDEGIAEFERYIDLVKVARKNPESFQNLTCSFDCPQDINEDALESVQRELEIVRKDKIDVEQKAKAERIRRENSQSWYSENFGRAEPGDARRRREDWYSEKGFDSRRWDSFGGRGPNKSSRQRGQQREKRNFNSDNKRNASSPMSPRAAPCHYKALGVPPDATDETIKKSYKARALRYHPDKNKDEDAGEMFLKVKAAYEVLSDPVARRKYDSERSWRPF